MASFEQIQRLIEELGPATPEVAEINQEEPGSWTVFFNDESSIDLDYVEEQDKLVLSTDLGAPPEENREFVHRLLLVFNVNWKETGGVKMGLQPPFDEVMMMFELNAAVLELASLQNVLASFAEKAASWRELIALGLQPENAGGTGAGTAGAENLAEGFLRV